MYWLLVRGQLVVNRKGARQLKGNVMEMNLYLLMAQVVPDDNVLNQSELQRFALLK